MRVHAVASFFFSPPSSVFAKSRWRQHVFKEQSSTRPASFIHLINNKRESGFFAFFRKAVWVFWVLLLYFATLEANIPTSSFELKNKSVSRTGHNPWSNWNADYFSNSLICQRHTLDFLSRSQDHSSVVCPEREREKHQTSQISQTRDKTSSQCKHIKTAGWFQLRNLAHPSCLKSTRNLLQSRTVMVCTSFMQKAARAMSWCGCV